MADRFPLIKPEPYEVTDSDGKVHKFIVSNFPAVQGREIIVKYPMSGIPKLGDFQVNHETMLKIMTYVAVPMPNGNDLRLETIDLINNHCPDWEVLAKVEFKMMEKNCSFFRDGRSWDFLENLTQMVLGKITETLTPLLAQSSPTDTPPSTS